MVEAVSDDAKDAGATTPDEDGSAGTQTTTGSGQDDLIASARKRQAGAEAARQAAEAKALQYEKELAKYREAAQTEEQKGLSELAATKARLDEAERRATEAEAKAEARILDTRFPNARKELPDLTDEVKLAKFEAMLADDDTVPTPTAHNESRSSSTAGKQAKPETAAEIAARLERMPMPDGWS